MLDIKFISSRGDILDLINDPLFKLSNVDGMTRYNSNISSTVVGTIDGDSVNNVQGQPRGIVLTMQIVNGLDVETAKRHLLTYFKAKQRGCLLWTQNGRTAEIYGIIESIEMPRWGNGVKMQVWLHCEQPYWEDIQEAVQTISDAINLHYFTEYPHDMLYFPAEGIPFGEVDVLRQKTFVNGGDVAVGMTIVISAVSEVTNPIIHNTDNDFFGVGYGTEEKQVVLEPGDYITITTQKGNKTVTLNGITSLMSKVKPSSKWLQIEPGSNILSISSDDAETSNMYFSISYRQRYV